MSNVTSKPTSAVLVVGAGIAGMQAALDLAAMNHDVYLLDRSATIGGNMTRLDKTFPTNDCSMCMISPKMVACARNPRIHILTLSELLGLQGEPGRFTAKVRRHPRYVDEKKCIGCRQCVDKCPKKAPNAYNGGLDSRKAIHFVHTQAIPMVPAIDTANCLYFQKGRCRTCEKVCPTSAVRMDEQPEDLDLNVGAVVISAGYELNVISQAGEFGYGRYPNVVTSIDYERMLSATGPFSGHAQRPSDGRKPKRVAWIQCVGSRDSARDRNFCSSVCCMAAVKQAILTREHDPESEATIFYMDMRAQGKDFDRYLIRARANYGVRFIRSMFSQVIQDPTSGNLIIEYNDRNTMEQRQEEFDLVILSAGMTPSQSMSSLMGHLGVEQNRYGFAASNPEHPTHTSREGVFVCGALDGPRDIPESVTGASAAASSAASLLARYREEVNTKPSLSIVRDVAGEAPRIGVFICHCGKNIAGVIRVDELREFALDLPHVEASEHFLFTCSTQTQERIKEVIREHRLNRVVVAACSPRTHEPLFRETLQQAGLNKYLFEMANIRDQCSWVHGQDPDAATDKARNLVGAAVARAALLEPIEEAVTRVVSQALIVGAGLAGMTAALSLADQGISVMLVEKSTRIGGIAGEIHHALEGHSPRQMVEDLALRVKTNKSITLLTEASLSSLGGGPGDFNGTVEQNGRTIPVACGAVIVATGGEPYRPSEYFYGQHPAVVTQLELEKRLFENSNPMPNATVMIQCVGSRNEEFALCSRVCCSAAIKNAIRLKETNPSGAVYILYRDIRTFGFKEEYYRRARDLGVIFVGFDPESPPDVELENDKLKVKVFDHGSGMTLEIKTELLVLSSGIRPASGSLEIAKMLKLPLMQEGFFIEAHPKLNPLDFSSAGIFLCGLAHSPRFVEESIAQAKGAACRAAGLLLQKEIQTSGAVAEVVRERCSSCLLCVYSCPYHVPVMDSEGISVIDPRKCHGCGVCVAECPAKAITFKHYTDDQVIAQALAAAS
jgi:heterodisulfide reductase subunit A2